MAEQTFKLPDLGEGIAEGELVTWLVQPGETVEEDQTLAEVETDKAVVEVPSPYDGVVTELHADEGEIIPVDSIIVTFEVGEDNVASGGAASGTTAETRSATESGVETYTESETETETPKSAIERVGSSDESGTEVADTGSKRVFAAPSTRTLARKLGVDLTSVSGSGPGGRVIGADVRAHTKLSSVGTADSESDTGVKSSTETTSGRDGSSSGGAGEESTIVESESATRDRTLAMPATRQVAREADVDINNVSASETRDGEFFVTADDVHAHVESGGEEVGSVEASTDRDSASVASSGPKSGERVPYKGIRRTIGEQMAKAKYTAPHVSHHDEFDAVDLVSVREELADAASAEDINLTYLPFVVKAVTRALQEHPYLNSSLDENGEEIVLHDEYNIGIAVATDQGLMVPVVKNADKKGLVEVAAEVDHLATRARNRELSREEMQGGTFTITNIGAIGGEFSSPIINFPEAAILAMGPIRKRPWVVNNEVVARETMRLSMSIDHRLVDGADAAEFTNRLQELLGHPAHLLL